MSSARMAVPQTHESSPYYPPRARWYGRFFTTYCPPGTRWYKRAFYIGNGFFWLLGSETGYSSSEITPGGLVAGIFVPGLAVYLRNPGILGKMALFASGLLLSVFIIWLGYPTANLAMWFLLSAHVSGFVYYCKPLVRDSLRARLVLTLLVWLALVMFVYLPAQSLIQRLWFMPLGIRGQMVVTQRDYPIQSIRTGDWIAYNIPDVWAEGIPVHIRAGMGLAPVLGTPGDRIVFLARTFTVNGIAHPSLARMPQRGTLVIPDNHWFIWPDIDPVNAAWHEGYGEQVSELLLSVAVVDRGQYLGKPFQRWFWRRQFEP